MLKDTRLAFRSMAVLLAALILVPILAACDLDGADGPPTPIVVTSTPASPQSEATPSLTEEASPTAEGDEPTEHAENPTPTATDAAEDDDEIDELPIDLEEIEQQVAELRQLPKLEDIDAEVIDREELNSRVDELVGEDYTPEQARIDALASWLLGLIPDREIDLYQLQLDLLGEQIAGYYDYTTDKLVVVTQDGEMTVSDKVTLAHEIDHALQDQHFDLESMDEIAEDDDQSFAITALTEGDATLLMNNYVFTYLDPMELLELFGESGNEDFDVFDNAPRYIQDSLLFPYQEGQTLVEALQADGGYERIDAAFASPPLSTEQILHPEKYLGPNPDPPVTVELTDISTNLGENWTLLDSNVLGEWDIRIMLDEMGADDATSAAAGWGGSRYQVYESGDGAAVSVLRTVWDSPDELNEYQAAMTDILQGLDQDNGLVRNGELLMTMVSGQDSVTYVSGTDPEAVKAAAEALAGS